MGVVERIQQLCKKNKVTFAELERELKIGNGVIRRWNDRTPASDKLIEVANYFDCSTDYLLGLTNEAPEETDFFVVLGSYLQKLTEEEKQSIMSFLKMSPQEKSIVMKLTNDIIKLRNK